MEIVKVRAYCIEGGGKAEIKFDLDHEGLCTFWGRYAPCRGCRYCKEE